MSMLAEPRRKQKWSVDPRNSAWSNDDSKFGQKMLERMGWSKGKGLGKSEQGATDHIKVKVKNDSYGLGANASCEDNWIAHQDDFNELLAQLNNCHGQNNGNSNEPAPDEQKGFSLEEKSKTSKKRVHYMKFAKGKDLSSRSETDLNCIFGKRARAAKDQEQESNSSDSQGETEEKGTPAASELDTESTTKTVTSTLSMQEYFAQRMAQLKKARGQAPSASLVEAETNASEEPSPIHSSNHESEEPKKKKKKKKKKAVGEVEVVEDTSSTPIVEKEDENQEQESSKKKKKKKRKMAENERATGENSSSTSGVEQNCEALPPSKKKKLKKHNEETELLNGLEPSEDQIVESEAVQKKKKKQKQKEEVGDVVEEEEVVEKKSKKDKKKKKKHQE